MQPPGGSKTELHDLRLHLKAQCVTDNKAYCKPINTYICIIYSVMLMAMPSHKL